MKKPSDFIKKGVLRSVTGDAVAPQGTSLMYVINLCGNDGKWGEDVFSKSLSKRFPKTEEEYKKLWRTKFGKLVAGEIQEIQVRADMAIFNVIGIDSAKKTIQYQALAKAFDKVGDIAGEYNNASIHIQKDAVQSLGVDWDQVLPVIETVFLKRGLNVFIYT
jgi:hypothetical protein